MGGTDIIMPFRSNLYTQHPNFRTHTFDTLLMVDLRVFKSSSVPMYTDDGPKR